MFAEILALLLWILLMAMLDQNHHLRIFQEVFLKSDFPFLSITRVFIRWSLPRSALNGKTNKEIMKKDRNYKIFRKSLVFILFQKKSKYSTSKKGISILIQVVQKLNYFVSSGFGKLLENLIIESINIWFWENSGNLSFLQET